MADEHGICTTFTHRAVPMRVDRYVDYIQTDGPVQTLTVYMPPCEGCKAKDAEIERLNAHIDDLAHQATHVTCQMDIDRLKAEVQRLAAQTDPLYDVAILAECDTWKVEGETLKAERDALAKDRDHYKGRALTAEERIPYYIGITRQVEAERDDARTFGEHASRLYNELLVHTQDVTCAFCGKTYPRGTPHHGDGALTEHILVCQQHPMRKVEAERDALKAKNAHLAVLVSQLQDFVARERALRDAVGKGGQWVNGPAPGITPSVLQDLERMIRDAPDVASNYARLEAQVNRHEQDIEAAILWARNEAVTWRFPNPIQTDAEFVARFKTSRKGAE